MVPAEVALILFVFTNRNYHRGLIRALTPSGMEKHQQMSSEVIIPVLEHGRLHFGSGCVSDLNIMITIGISPRASLWP